VLRNSLERIFTTYDDQDDPLRLVNLQSWILRFLLDVVAIARKHARAAMISPTIRRVQDHVEDHLEEIISLEDLADLACLSLSRFKMRFKKEVGIPPADYISGRRVARAEQLLAAPSATITNVAMRLGFSTSQYFATVFKRYTGVTPSAYRRSAGR